jgi:hypothetical protein
MHDAEHLRQQLKPLFALRQQRNPHDPQLHEQLNELRQRLSPPRGKHSLPRIAQGVLAFRIQGRETPYPHLKYACYGVARPTDWDNRLIIDDSHLFDALLSAVSALEKSHPPAYRACCKALQISLQTDLPQLSDTRSMEIQQNSRKLADFCTRTFYERNSPPKN